MNRSTQASIAVLSVFATLAIPHTVMAAGMPPASVSIMEVTPQDIPVSFEYIGQIAGSKEVEIRSRISGVIEKRAYKEGANVTAGQLLFKIDQAQFKAHAAQSQAAVTSARAQTSLAQAQLNKADRELKRLRPLAKRQLVSPSDLDNAKSDVDIANAQVLIAKAAVQQAKANLTTSNIDLEYTQVRSPINGIAGRALKTEGSLTEVGSNSLMTTVVQVNPAYANFGVAEAEHLAMKSDLSQDKLLLSTEGFNVELLSSEGRLLQSGGKLDFQDYKVNNSTGNFAMRATIKNDEQLLSPGQFVRVRLSGAKRPAAIAVPQRAVLDDPGGKYVYTMITGKEGATIAMKKPVVPGEWVKLEGELSNGWIIKDGLVAGDKVIVDGSARIFFPGMPVVESAAQAPAAAKASH